MTPEDEKYLAALLAPIRQDINEIKEGRSRDISAILSRLNLLDRSLAVMEAKAEVKGGIFGAATGLIFGILGDLISRSLL